MFRRFCLSFVTIFTFAAGGLVAADGIQKIPFPGGGELTAFQDAEASMPVSLFGNVSYDGDSVPASVNVFLFQGGRDIILIDAGYGSSRGSLDSKLAAAKVSPGDITAVFLTHIHPDHIGGLLNGNRCVFPNAEIYVSGADDRAAGLAGSPMHGAWEKVRAVYGSRIHPFQWGDMLPGGFLALDAHGHTPGHTAFLRGKDLWFGDLIHGAALQFTGPSICAEYDMSTRNAVAARKKILSRAAGAGYRVFGAHLPFPGYGTVRRNGAGFVFTPGK